MWFSKDCQDYLTIRNNMNLNVLQTYQIQSVKRWNEWMNIVVVMLLKKLIHIMNSSRHSNHVLFSILTFQFSFFR
jgi:hypothetical protein